MEHRSTAPHRRYNPLRREWVLVSTHRTDRPWLGEKLEAARQSVPQYDPACYLCPGNERAGGARNPHFEGTYVFTNDYPALLPPPNRPERSEAEPRECGDLLRAEPDGGECRVVCFSPRHDLHLGTMSDAAVTAVLDTWAQQYAELSALPYVNAVTIFENRGPMMGASNPHPHSQIWAETAIPNELAMEAAAMREYARERSACLLCRYATLEIERGERVVYADDRVAVVVPFWAVWPFELLAISRSHRGTLHELDESERAAWARAMRALLGHYDRLFGVPFPYSMGFHQRPCNGSSQEQWHLHAHYYPPLLRSATVRKYMVGYEMLAQPQRDLTAERAAELLRNA